MKNKLKEKRVRCPICGKYSFPTQDHVPPKSCGNNGRTLTHYFITKVDGTEVIKESQKGMHYDYICSKCNNEILGSNLDIELKKLYDVILNSPDINIKWQGDVKKISKCILGHILATNKYSSALWDKEMRNFILKDKLPKLFSLYLFYYPYNATFTIKHAVPVLFYENSARKNYICPNNVMLDCLYFNPLAFIVVDKGSFPVGIDLLDLVNKGEDTIVLNKNSWVDIVNKVVLPPCWPFMISNNKKQNTIDAIVGGSDMLSSNITIKKPKDFKFK